MATSLCAPGCSGKIGKVLEIKQMRLGERAPRQRTSNVSCGLLERFIRRDERWLEFKVGCVFILLGTKRLHICRCKGG
jgi:hypothetical protein